MSKRFGTAVMAATGICLLATWVPAQVTDPSKDEQKCESGTGKTLAKFVGSKSKCMVHRHKRRRWRLTHRLPAQCTVAGCSPRLRRTPTRQRVHRDGEGREARHQREGVQQRSRATTRPGATRRLSAACPASHPWVQTTEGTPFPIAGRLTAFPRLIYRKETADDLPRMRPAQDGVSRRWSSVGAKNKCYSSASRTPTRPVLARRLPPPPPSILLNSCIHDP